MNKYSPSGMNLTQLADLLRLYYPNPTYDTMSDFEVVDYFKKTEPDMMDKHGGWDEVVVEPSTVTKLTGGIQDIGANLKSKIFPIAAETFGAIGEVTAPVTDFWYTAVTGEPSKLKYKNDRTGEIIDFQHEDFNTVKNLGILEGYTDVLSMGAQKPTNKFF